MSDNTLIEGFDSVNLKDEKDDRVLFLCSSQPLISTCPVEHCSHLRVHCQFIWRILQERVCSLQP